MNSLKLGRDESAIRPSIALPTPRFPHLPTKLGEVRAFRENESYLVGGVVRDVLLGRKTSDIDVAVVGDAGEAGAELVRRFGGTLVVLDHERGTVRVALPEGADARFIDISPARDGVLADLSRRDFTVNAMAVPLADLDGEPIDPHGGGADALAGVVRMVSPSVFTDDPARLLRGPRLAAQLRFGLDDGTAEAIRRHAHLLTEVAPERVREEVLKLLAEPGATNSLRLVDDLGLFARVFPELDGARGVSQPKEHYWDVFDHCIETVGQIERLTQSRTESNDVARQAPWDPDIEAHFAAEASDEHSRLTLLKLAGLLHDVGKPDTKTIERSGRVRFLGHHTLGAEIAEQVLSRLRLSRKGVELVSRLVEHHLRPSQMAQGDDLPTPHAIYRFYRGLGDAAIDTLYLNLADYMAARGPDLDRQDWLAHIRTMAHILEGGHAQSAPLSARLIDGNRIMREFSLEPGPQIGRLLEKVDEARASGDVSSADEALDLIRTAIRAGGAGA